VGTNDIQRREPGEIAGGVETLCKSIKLKTNTLFDKVFRANK
jgi:hypothetical protein